MREKVTRVVGLLLASGLTMSACGFEAPAPRAARPAASLERDAFPVTVEAANGPTTIPGRPERIVSLSPTATEMLFAIGAGDQVVAVDDNSDFPPLAPTTDLSGFEPNIEAVAAHDPDLVVASDDPAEVVSSLERLGIPVLLQPAARALRDSYAQIHQLGTATGHVEGARNLVARMRSDIDEIVDATPGLRGDASYYHELDQHLFTVTSDTFLGHIYALFGLRNIADAARGASSGYPQLSAEYIIEANPDLVFLADTECCNVTARRVAARPGWNRIDAVRAGHVYELDDDVASRWGPRIVRLVRGVARAVEELAASRA